MTRPRSILPGCLAGQRLPQATQQVAARGRGPRAGKQTERGRPFARHALRCQSRKLSLKLRAYDHRSRLLLPPTLRLGRPDRMKVDA